MARSYIFAGMVHLAPPKLLLPDLLTVIQCCLGPTCTRRGTGYYTSNLKHSACIAGHCARPLDPQVCSFSQKALMGAFQNVNAYSTQY